MKQKWLESCPTSFKPVSYYRYIDDTFAIISDEAHVDEFLDFLNVQHPKITFTAQIEIDHALDFLDLNISLSSGTPICDIYRKPTFTGLGTSYFSNVS